MSVSILLPIIRSSDGSSELMFVDLSSFSVYDTSGRTVCEEKAAEVVAEIAKQQEESAAEMPYDQIREVLETEKNLSKESENHVFRRRH